MELDAATVSEAIGRMIVAARHESGLSQDQLARLVGVDRTYLSALERGHRTLRLERLIMILDVLGLRLTVEPKSGATDPDQPAPGP